MGFFKSSYLMDEIRSCNLHINTTADDGKTQKTATLVSALIATRLRRTQ